MISRGKAIQPSWCLISTRVFSFSQDSGLPQTSFRSPATTVPSHLPPALSQAFLRVSLEKRIFAPAWFVCLTMRLVEQAVCQIIDVFLPPALPGIAALEFEGMPGAGGFYPVQQSADGQIPLPVGEIVRCHLDVHHFGRGIETFTGSAISMAWW
jgi:hypothetical protein